MRFYYSNGKINKVGKAILYFLCILIIESFIIYYINREKYIFFWDISFFWSKYQYLCDLFKNDPLNAIEVLINSIHYEDYNLLPLFFLIPFSFLFGDGRLAFISSIVVIFALPTIIVTNILIEKILLQYKRQSFAIYLIPILTIILFPQFWIPILLGEVGVLGVLIINLILIIYIKNPIEKQSVFNLILIGSLLCLLILIRRWYAYWVVSFFIALIIERSIFLFQSYRFNIKNYMPSAKNIFIIGAVALILFFLIATPIAKRMLFTSYVDIYSAYRFSSSIIDFVIKFYNYFGCIFVLFFILGLIDLIYIQKEKNFSIFIIIQFIITFFLFSRTQDFTSKHYYLLIPTIIIFITFFIIDIYENLKKKINKSIFLSIFILFLLINFSVVFVPETSNSFNKFDFVLSEARLYPLVRNDIGEIDNMLNVLQYDLLKNKDDSVYILSSSFIFNDDILRNACRIKGNTTLCDKILITNHVDKRDGFPLRFLYAKYVIIADPIQYHLRPQDQRVIGAISEQILNQKNIGISYKKLPYNFSLDNNVKVFIYEKVEPFKKSDLDNLSNFFFNYYPDKKYIFSFNHICGLIQKTEADDNAGYIRYALCSWNTIIENNYIAIHPRLNNQSKLFLKFNKEYSHLNMSFAFLDNPEDNKNICREREIDIYSNNFFIRLYADNKIVFQKEIDFKQIVSYQLDLKNIDILEIDIEKGINGPYCDNFLIRDIEIQ